MSVVFSVITITYNAAPVLQRTLDSVARQTYEGVEHIIVDGASKDATVAMAEKYKVCHQSFYARLDIARETPYDTQFRYSADVDWCIRIMKKAAERGQLLVPIPAVTTRYMEEGQTTLHHKDSLRERFEVMRRHYGLLTTVAMHAWFVLRKIMGGKN